MGWKRAAVAAALLASASCTGSGNKPHPSLAAVWRDYQQLPAERALAVAGDPERARWVAGASGGHATRAEAEERALEECGLRRVRQRIQAACELYGSGDQIVWPRR